MISFCRGGKETGGIYGHSLKTLLVEEIGKALDFDLPPPGTKGRLTPERLESFCQTLEAHKAQLAPSSIRLDT